MYAATITYFPLPHLDSLGLHVKILKEQGITSKHIRTSHTHIARILRNEIFTNKWTCSSPWYLVVSFTVLCTTSSGLFFLLTLAGELSISISLVCKFIWPGYCHSYRMTQHRDTCSRWFCNFAYRTSSWVLPIVNLVFPSTFRFFGTNTNNEEQAFQTPLDPHPT